MAIFSNSVNNTLGRSNIKTASPGSGVSRSNSLGVSEGQLIKGTVTDVQGNRITIERDDGTAFTGQLSDASKYSIGQRAAFQVTSASPNTILLKALSDYYLLNSDDMVFKALEEANLPKSPHNIDVIRALMSTKQSISRESILDALKFCSRYPEVSADAVLTMKYLAMPMTEESVKQFEQYQNKTHQLINQMETMTDSINEVLTLIGKQAPDASGNIGMQFLDMALENKGFSTLPALDTAAAAPGELLVSSLAPDGTPLPEGTLLINGQPVKAGVINGEIVLSDPTDPLTNLTAELKELIENTPKENIKILSDSLYNEIPEHQSPMKLQAGTILTGEAKNDFYTLIKDLPLSEQLKQGVWEGTALGKDILSELRTVLPLLPAETSGKILSSPGFQALLKNQLLDGWSISPEELKNGENLEKLYERLESQLEQVSKFSETVLSHKTFSELNSHTNNVQGNLNFMKTLNENLMYMQLPLRLAEENAHGDLYVMTKKDAMKKHPDKLKILLHLELDHLGVLDIHIEKESANVRTKFYVEDKKIVRLFEKNIELLSDALLEQGYLLNNETLLHEKELDFVKDFVAQDVPIGDMKRYNFDLRA